MKTEKKPRAWKKIVRHTSQDEEHTSRRGNTLSWWKIKVTTLRLECGHTKVYRGDYFPTMRTVCPVCEKNMGP